MNDPMNLTAHARDLGNGARRSLDPAAVAGPGPGSGILTGREWSALAEQMKLSEREFQIVLGVFDDKKEVAIARDLQISAHTVHTYLGRLYRKLGVQSRAQLIVRVFAEYVARQAGGGPTLI